MPSLSQLVAEATARAIERGVLLPLQSEVVEVSENGLRYTISSLSSLSLKDMAGVLQKSAGGNPFLPYEKDLFVTNLSPTHVLLLNKFPIDQHHVMAVTREFVPQVAPLERSDFHALALLLQAADGLAMFNGGKIAGASQPHRHLHMMPGRTPPLASTFPIDGPADVVQQIPQFRFVHAFIRLDDNAIAASATTATDYLQDRFSAAAAHCHLQPANGEMPPYDLLATRGWLLVVPRSQGTWTEGDVTVLVSALDFGGQLGVRNTDQIDVVRKAGLLKILEATAIAK
ncbi:MAG: hypothetical protein ABW049_14185 [Spongiibacteraceae bacterium]